jgi:hypothetical protein
MLILIVTAAAFTLLLLASAYDLKTGEIPDKITNGYAAAMLALTAVAFLSGSGAKALYGPLIGLAYFLVAYALYHYGQWGGGDVKLLACVGCTLGLLDALGYHYNAPLLPYYLVYLIDMGFLVMPYALAYTITLGLSKPAVFKRFLSQLAGIKPATLLLLSFAPPILLYLSTQFTPFLLLSAVMPLVTLTTLFLKTSEEILLTKTIKTADLKESDALAEDLSCCGEKIALKREIEGIGNKTELIKKLASEGKIPSEIRIRWGVRFAPIIALSFLATVYVGDFMALLARSLPAIL